MNRNKLAKLRRRIAELRHASAKAIAFQRLAKQLGREKDKNRGKEPTWVNRDFPALRPLSIPDHGGRDIPYGTKQSMLNQLEEDVYSWDELLLQQESEKIKGVK